jgi:putative membrane protein insertion efficiency factor
MLLAVVGFYQRAISPALPPRCRFAPTCSAYAAEAIAVHGAGRGTWLALRRLLKCAPWHPGGFDPVPPARTTPSGTDRATPPHPGRAPQEESSRA